MRLGIGLLPVLMASACVAPSEPPPPPPAPAPTPAPAPPPPPAPPPADWRDRDYTPGDWSYVRVGGRSEARYGTPGAPPRLTLVCDPAVRQVQMEWAGAPAGRVTVSTTYGDVARQALPSATGVQLALAPADPLLDQIAFSRGRFMLTVGGQSLILPAWAEVSRVVEDCR